LEIFYILAVAFSGLSLLLIIAEELLQTTNSYLILANITVALFAALVLSAFRQYTHSWYRTAGGGQDQRGRLSYRAVSIY
jgi:hypothetical protein